MFNFLSLKAVFFTVQGSISPITTSFKSSYCPCLEGRKQLLGKAKPWSFTYFRIPDDKPSDTHTVSCLPKIFILVFFLLKFAEEKFCTFNRKQHSNHALMQCSQWLSLRTPIEYTVFSNLFTQTHSGNVCDLVFCFKIQNLYIQFVQCLF